VVELGGEGRGANQVAKQHGELAAFGVGKTWDFSSSGGRDVFHQWSLVRIVGLCHNLRCSGRRGRCWGTCPHQDAALLIDGKALCIDQGLLQSLQPFLVQLKLELELRYVTRPRRWSIAIA
jgi:hypothetical protein